MFGSAVAAGYVPVLAACGCDDDAGAAHPVSVQQTGGASGGAASPTDPGGGRAGAREPEGGTRNAAPAGAGAGGAAGASGSAGESLPLEGQPCAGYTLIGIPQNDAGSDFTATLIDMDGTLVHRFAITGFPPRMLPGGSLVGCMGVFPTSYDCVQIQQVSWTGQLEWSFSNWVELADGTTAARQHHDLLREGNPVGYYAPGQDFVDQGNTLVLAHNERNAPEIRDVGPLEDDVIYEVDASGTLTSFQWHGVDHFEQFGFDEAARADIRTRDPDVVRMEWLHGNTLARLGQNHWFDEGHAEFHPDNIIYSSRNASFVVIIAHDTGEVVWRIGPHFAGRPEEKLGQFSGQHVPHMIPMGLPGEGNLLVFDNGGVSGFGGESTTGVPNRYFRGHSRVIEFDPVTLDILWEYGSAQGEQNFYSAYVGSVQRLPNGNTLINVGMGGRIMEVTPDQQVVWEHQFVVDSSGDRADWLYRAYRVPPEWLPEGENEALGNYATWASLFEARD